MIACKHHVPVGYKEICILCRNANKIVQLAPIEQAVSDVVDLEQDAIDYHADQAIHAEAAVKRDLDNAAIARAEQAEGDKTTIHTESGSIVQLVEQPKPKFTIIDLEQMLDKIFLRTMTAAKDISDEQRATIIKEANGFLQELIAKVNKVKNDLDSIDIPSDVNNSIITELNTEKVAFHVCGVQLWENGKAVGTSLYSTVFKARKIRNILNAKFDELNVKHEAKIVNYPVY